MRHSDSQLTCPFFKSDDINLYLELIKKFSKKYNSYLSAFGQHIAVRYGSVPTAIPNDHLSLILQKKPEQSPTTKKLKHAVIRPSVEPKRLVTLRVIATWSSSEKVMLYIIYRQITPQFINNKVNKNQEVINIYLTISNSGLQRDIQNVGRLREKHLPKRSFIERTCSFNVIFIKY